MVLSKTPPLLVITRLPKHAVQVIIVKSRVVWPQELRNVLKDITVNWARIGLSLPDLGTLLRALEMFGINCVSPGPFHPVRASRSVLHALEVTAVMPKESSTRLYVPVANTDR